MQFLEIAWQSDTYQAALKLRDDLLRRPLGLAFTDHDLEGESSQLHFGIMLESRLIACVVAVRLAESHVKLRQMAVESTQQGKGVGSCLMRATESRLKELGIRSVELNAREPVIGFYERLGFQPAGEPFVEVSIPHQRMVKTIA